VYASASRSAGNSRRWSNRRLAATVLGCMALMALLSFGYAMYTVDFRRNNDPKALPTVLALEAPLPPAKWRALDYLPTGCNLVVGIQVARARETPVGQAFLAQTDLGKLGFGLADIERATGLKAEELDHVIIGARLDAQLVMVARTKQAYDVRRIRTALKARSGAPVGNRTIYYFDLERPKVPAVLWLAEEDRMVVASILTKEGIASIPNPPVNDSGQLPPALEAMLKERTTRNDLVWMAGHAEKLDAARPFLEKPLGEDATNALLALRTFVLGLQLDGEIVLNGTFSCADDAGAKSLEKVLARVKENDGTHLKVLGSSREAAKVAKELADSFDLQRKGNLLTLKAAASEATVKAALPR